VRRFDTEYPERFADEVFNYLSITQKDFPVASKVFERPTVDKEYFMHLAEKFRSPHLWEKVNGEWKLRYHVS